MTRSLYIVTSLVSLFYEMPILPNKRVFRCPLHEMCDSSLHFESVYVFIGEENHL